MCGAWDTRQQAGAGRPLGEGVGASPGALSAGGTSVFSLSAAQGRVVPTLGPGSDGPASPGATAGARWVCRQETRRWRTPLQPCPAWASPPPETSSASAGHALPWPRVWAPSRARRPRQVHTRPAGLVPFRTKGGVFRTWLPTPGKCKSVFLDRGPRSRDFTRRRGPICLLRAQERLRGWGPWPATAEQMGRSPRRLLPTVHFWRTKTGAPSWCGRAGTRERPIFVRN